MFVKQSDVDNVSTKYSWLRNEVKKSESVIEKTGFPCIFGVQGYKRKVHCFSALNYPYSPKELAEDIDTYLSELKGMNEKNSGLSGLLVYFEPIGNMRVHSKQFMCWDILNTMKINYGLQSDTKDSNPLSDNYSFKFKGELWFINFSSNSYQNRQSRNLGSFITLAMQTLSKSDAYFNSDIKIKAKAQTTIRNLTEKFDGCPVHSGLGPIIGSGEFSPAKLSYFIGDTNEEESFQPWKYKKFQPKKVIIDEDLLKSNNKKIEFTEFKKRVENFEVLILNKDINIKEIQIANDLNNLLISNNLKLIESVYDSITICTFDINKSLKKECYKIDYLNDLFALYTEIESEVPSNV